MTAEVPGRSTGLIPTGTTDVYAIVGHPAVQVAPPGLYNLHFASSGLDAVFVAYDLDRSAVPAFFDVMRSTRNLKGGFVTVPHKQAATACMDELTSRAAALGAVNAVRNDDGRRIWRTRTAPIPPGSTRPQSAGDRKEEAPHRRGEAHPRG